MALLAGSCRSLAEGGEVARVRGGGGGTGPGTAGGHLHRGLHYSTVQYSSAATHLETGGDRGPQPRLEVVATAGAGCRGWGASSG